MGKKVTKKSKTFVRLKKIYTVNHYKNGFCYCTHTECTWKDVVNLRKTAKMLGETINYTLDRVEKEIITY